MTIETRAARLVAALERAGRSVSSLTISGDEIKVTFSDHEDPAVNPCDLIDWRNKPTSRTRAKKA